MINTQIKIKLKVQFYTKSYYYIPFFVPQIWGAIYMCICVSVYVCVCTYVPKFSHKKTEGRDNVEKLPKMENGFIDHNIFHHAAVWCGKM